MTVTANETHSLYRLHDERGGLIYVGVTTDCPTRFAAHRVEKPWWHEVHDVTVQTFPSRGDALVAERATIRAEQPKYNANLLSDPVPVRTVRVPNELWQAAQDRVWERREKEGVAAPLRLALRAYVADPDAFEVACRRIAGEL